MVGQPVPPMPGRRGAAWCIYDIFEAADGPVFIGVTSEAHWQRFCAAFPIDDLRDEVGRPGNLGSLWMLLPMAATGLPTVDDVPVPVITSTQWANVPVAWAKNLHRAASAV